MKKITLVCFMLFSMMVDADSVSKEETCDGWVNKAKQFMKVRQNNTPIHEAMKMTVGNFSRGLMLRAYNEAVAEEGEKQRVIEHFAEMIENECINEPE
ncbi:MULTISPECIES: hypothetical protein [unclassified Methylophaga]|jgi:hypothetical protein|uniref:hypothetical protein n=1 Tax=unclassified Methylophaga TaxID=2629249 RepID=UPI00259D281D|nr:MULTISPECIES: hypothetical protein [unclassified Methylophaga]|tara:strand:- start:230 stop:523 length:294 start_codon:yes stop_codon:yes gene_type:complete